jgi:TonB family protein
VKPKAFPVKAAIAALATIATLCGGCNSSARLARQQRELNIHREMELGKHDFGAQQFDSAQEHLKKALSLDDNLTDARMGLADIYAVQYIPGLQSPGNMITWQKAVDAFQAVLAKDPKNVVALKSLGALYFDTRKFSEAREFYLRATLANPNDADAYYNVGVMDWGAAYQETTKRKSEAGLGADTAFRNNPQDQKRCMDLQAANEARIEDGLKNLTLAMEKRQDFAEAMSYMSLLYQRKADIECGNPGARTEDLSLVRKFAADAAASRDRGQQQSAQPSGIGSGNGESTDDFYFSKLAEQILSTAPPPPPPPPPPQEQRSANRVHITPAEMDKNLITRLKPDDPSMAKFGRVGGDVTLRVIVGTDGRVKTVSGIAGSPILQQAAIEAVKHWVYKPFLVNGEPVEAESTVTINFPSQ